MPRQKRNSNGAGGVSFDKSSNKYRAYITTPQGKRIQKRFDTKQAAESWRAEQLAAISNNLFVEPQDLTLFSWIKTYLTTYAKPKVKAKTYHGYKQNAKHLAPLFMYPVQKLTPIILQDFFNTMSASASMKHRVKQFLSQILKKAYVLRIISHEPTAAITLPPIEQKEIETFTTGEIKQLLEIAKTSHYAFMYPLVLLAATSGARLGEILGLKANNVFADRIKITCTLTEIQGRIIETPPKTSAALREITLPDTVIQALHESLAKPPYIINGYVFHTPAGTPYRPSNIETYWRKLFELANISRRHFHALRHTHATELLAKGIPILEVSHRLGHAKASHTLNLYGHAIKGYDEKIKQEVSEIYL